MALTRRHGLLLAGILVVAASLRMWGAFYDLPYIFHADEPRYIGIIQDVFKTGDLNPHFFNYPSMFLYVNALAHAPYFWLGKFVTPQDILPPITLAMGTSLAQTPESVALARTITILFSVGCVALVFLIGRRLTGESWVGLIAAGGVAVSPALVTHGRYITPDTFVTFWALVTLGCATLIMQRGRTSDYVLAGLSAGFTAASKYNGALVVLLIIAAHFLRTGRASWRDARLVAALGLSIVGFLLITPFAILDAPRFLADVRFEAQHYASGHAGMEGDTLAWYVSYVLSWEGIVFVLALIQITYGLWTRSKATLLLTTYVVPYFVFISTYAVRNDRTLLPAMPLFILLSAMLLVELTKGTIFISRRSASLSRRAAAGLAVLAISVPAWNTMKMGIERTFVDSRTTARSWIDQTLPNGSKITVESYSPFVDPARFNVQGVGRIIDQPLDWYVNHQVDYLVFSQGMFGRYFRQPNRYAKEVAQYERFFEKLEPIQMFLDGGYEIRVYRLPKSLK
jgi:4-amino-4-deoxy-L-arabinose transferase-like glycosyltransferase